LTPPLGLVNSPAGTAPVSASDATFPEWIRLDDWGFPIVDPRPVPAGLEEHAARAVKECPSLALRLSATRARKKALAAPR
jgi:hypothetical protein